MAVVPHNRPGTLGYLTLWPTGQAKPLVSTLNSIDGRIKRHMSSQRRPAENENGSQAAAAHCAK